jgi:outer membrane protein assembly factor BamB
MSKLIVTIFTFSALQVLNPVAAQLADSAWPDYGGGYANQHRSPYRGPASNPGILWSFDLRSLQIPQFQRGYHQPILLPDETLALNTADSSADHIIAIRPDGTLRWRLPASTLGPWLAAGQNEQIYTIRMTSGASSSAQLRAVSFTGTHRWSTSLPGTQPTQNGPAIGHGGEVYAAVDFAPLQAIAPTGVTSWSSAPSGYYVNPAIGADGTIYVGGNSLTAMAPDGRVKWSYPALEAPNRFPKYLSAAISDDGTIFAGQINSPNLVALSPDGRLLWSRADLDGAPAIGTNSDVYVVSESGILTAVDSTTGITRWTYTTGKTDYYNSEGVTVDVDGNLYVSNDQGILRSLTPQGSLRWTFDLAPEISGFAGISAPIIGRNGVLYVVGGETGQVFAVIPEPSTIALAVTILISLLMLHWRRFFPTSRGIR